MTRSSERAEPAVDLEAVDAGQHEIEHDEIREIGAGSLDRVTAVRDAFDVVALALQVAHDDLGDGRVVVDDEHTGDIIDHAPDPPRRKRGVDHATRVPAPARGVSSAARCISGIVSTVTTASAPKSG